MVEEFAELTVADWSNTYSPLGIIWHSIIITLSQNNTTSKTVRMK